MHHVIESFKLDNMIIRSIINTFSNNLLIKTPSSGDRRPTLQPVRGVTYEPSLPKGMRRACGRKTIRLERRRGVGALLRSI